MYKKTRDRPDIALFGKFAEYGGVQRRLANMIKVWYRRGYKISLVTWRGGKCFYPQEIEEMVSVTHLNSKSKLFTLFLLWIYLRNTKPKLIMSTNHQSNIVVSCLYYLPDTATKRFVNVPNTFGASVKKDVQDKKNKLRQVQRFYPKNHGVIAISEGVRKDLLQNCKLDESIIYKIFNASVSQDILTRSQEPINHPWLKKTIDEPVLISVGRLSPQKDQATLIEALAIVQNEVPCRLIILGDGPLREDLLTLVREKGLKDKVELTGFVSNPYAWMAKADCFVLSSIWEGFPNVLAEALSLGIPIISTDCPSGPAEILDQGKYGYLVHMKDSHALAKAIVQTLQGNYCKYDPKEATAKYTAEVVAEEYLRAFKLDAHSS